MKQLNLNTILPLLKNNSPLEIFKKVVDFNTNTNASGERAVVRMGLGSGFIIEGTPLKMDKDGNAIFTASDNSISYINAKNIAGIQLLNPEVLLSVLTDGAHFHLDNSNIPTNLELKRSFKTISETLKDNYRFETETDFFDKDDMSEAEKFQFQQFMEILSKTLKNIAQDTLGKEALDKLNHLNIKNGEMLKVNKSANDSISLSLNFNYKFANNLEQQLQTALESNL